MSWGSFEQFLHMGGYGLYVWGSYAVTLGLLAIEAALLVSGERARGRGIGANEGAR